MRPIAVTVSGFRAYGSETTIPFNDGLTAIVGPNKSGKSSTFLAIMWALYGPAALRDIGITQGDCIHEGFDRCRVSLVFHATPGGLHKIDREYLASGTTKLALEGAGAVDITGATVRETQATIDALVGEYSVAAQSWYCGQDADKSFMFATPAERMEVFSTLLPSRTNWDMLHDQAKVKRVHADNHVTVCETQIELLTEQADQVDPLSIAHVEANATLIKARFDLTAAETELTRLQAEAEGMEKRKAAQTAVIAGEDAFETHKGTYGRATAVIARKEAIAAVVESDADAVIGYHKEFTAYQWRQAEREQWDIAKSIGMLEHQLSRHNIGACPTCKRPFREGEDESKALVDTEASELRQQLEEIKTARDVTIAVNITAGKPAALPVPVRPEPTAGSVGDIIALDDAEKNITTLENVYRSSRESFDSAKAVVEELGEAPTVSTGPSANIQHNIVVNARIAVETAVTAHARSTERLETARKAVTTLAETETALSAAQTTLNDWELLVRATGPRGVRQLAVSQSLAGIDSTVNRALDILDPGTHLYLSTQREAGDGSQAETLEATIVGQDGVAAFGTRSGAEKTRIAIAMRAALEVARAQALGSEANATFIIDEAFGAQDVAGKDNFIRFLRWLVDDLGVNVLLVTHDADMQERFDQTIQVSKVDGEAVLA